MDIRTASFAYFLVLQAASGTDVKAYPCNVHDTNADCSGLGISDISNISNYLPNDLTELWLNNNKISDIPERTFSKFSFLQTLRLDYNMIMYLKSSVFEELSNLETLSLTYNMLRHKNSYMPDVFKPLFKLKRLFLQGNCDVHQFSCHYPDMALSVLHSLQHLHLDGIPNTDFGAGFSQLKQLHSLQLSDDRFNGYCRLPELTESTFKSFRKTPLTYLKLDGCDIRYLAPNTFRGLRNLTTLIIMFNFNLCSNSIENATVGLNETNIETIKFNFKCRRPPYYPVLAEGNFQGLSNTSLKILDLGWNNIYYVDSSVINNLPTSVEYISLKENSIQTARFLSELKRLDNLETFDGSYQSHYDVVLKTNVNDYKIHKMIPSSPKQIIIPRKFQDARDSSPKFLGSMNITEVDGSVTLPRNLRRLYINNIKLGYPVPPVRFGPNNLQYLDASHCMLQAFLGPWYGLKHLKVLNISYNRFRFFHPLSLIDMGNLTALFLQSNEIGKSLGRDTKGTTFSSLRNLKELDLSNNVIKDLPYMIFKNQINLRKLSLADNSLKNVSFFLKSMGKLQHLDLSVNEIEYLSTENMKFLEHIAAKGDIYLNLTGNTLSCMCDNQAFVNWLAATKVNFVEKGSLVCLYRNKTVVSLSRIEEIRAQLKYECTLWIVMTSSVITFVSLVLLLALFALIYHKRWQLRYLWYIGRIKIDPFHHPEEQQALLEIDAYISYEQHFDVTHDVTLHRIITEKLYPFFEERGYTIRIREEFDGYEKLYHAIPQAVRKCRKVIVIVTTSYCEDYWNTFEFNIAAYEGIYTKRNVIIPVLIGNISDEHLTPEICSFIRSKIKSNEVLRLPLQGNLESHIKAFNQQLERSIRC